MDKNSENKKRNRILATGLDSADYYLVQKWVNDGYLPTNKRGRIVKTFSF